MCIATLLAGWVALIGQGQSIERTARARATPLILVVDPRIGMLIQRIDDDFDMCHMDWTPAVNDLIEIGPPAIDQLLELMLLDDSSSFTRMHGETALRGILLTMYGFRFGHGWPNPGGVPPPDAERRFLEHWRALGDLRWDAPLALRLQSVQRWREWLAKGAPLMPAQPADGEMEQQRGAAGVF